jgi:hypothetical protein
MSIFGKIRELNDILKLATMRHVCKTDRCSPVFISSSGGK